MIALLWWPHALYATLVTQLSCCLFTLHCNRISLMATNFWGYSNGRILNTRHRGRSMTLHSETIKVKCGVRRAGVQYELIYIARLSEIAVQNSSLLVVSFIGCTRVNLVCRFSNFVFHCIAARWVQLPLPVPFTACTPQVLPATALANVFVFGVTGNTAANSRWIRASAQCMIALRYNCSSEDGKMH